MCGFAGILNYIGDIPNENRLKEMGDIVKHRGPDDEGYFFSKYIGFAFRRLSIIDIEGGHQPMTKGNHTIVFNGELYNYKILKKELEGLGHDFVTKSDSEVVLTAYVEWQEKALNKFNGMWAFAIWDKHENELFLSRDRLGIKPLYVAKKNDDFYFASEIKSILKGGFTAEINSEDLAEYFHFGYIAGAKTLFKNIYAITPGTWKKYSLREEKEESYWNISNEQNDLKGTKEETENKVLNLLEDSTSFRLISDVSVGSLLSGGVDSSILSLLANRNLSNETLHTYCAIMDSSKYDESGYAKDASVLCNSFHKTVSVSKEEYLSLLPYVAWLRDEPLLFNNELYMFSVCQLAKKDNSKVLLSGEGADELFGGYIRYSETLNRISGKKSKFSQDELLMLGSAVYGFEKVNSLIGRTDWENPWRNDCYQRLKHLSQENILMRLDQSTRLVSLLYRQDRMSMGTGVEARVPFIDHRIVELANQIPIDLKLKNGKTKLLLKDLAVNLGFKYDNIYRPKVGFTTPINDWVKLDTFNPYLSFVGKGDSSVSERYDIDYARKLLKENRLGEENHGTILWMLISLEIWSRIFIDRTLDTNF